MRTASTIPGYVTLLRVAVAVGIMAPMTSWNFHFVGVQLWEVMQELLSMRLRHLRRGSRCPKILVERLVITRRQHLMVNLRG